jgi:hypothetical protein
MAQEKPYDYRLYSQDRQSLVATRPLPDGMVVEQKVEPRDHSPRIKIGLRPRFNYRHDLRQLPISTTTPLRRRRPSTPIPIGPGRRPRSAEESAPRRLWSSQDDLERTAGKDLRVVAARPRLDERRRHRATPPYPLPSNAPPGRESVSRRQPTEGERAEGGGLPVTREGKKVCELNYFFSSTCKRFTCFWTDFSSVAKFQYTSFQNGKRHTVLERATKATHGTECGCYYRARRVRHAEPFFVLCQFLAAVGG